MRFLHNTTVGFMGDSHLRFLSNHLHDFIAGPCDPSIYTHKDGKDLNLPNVKARGRKVGKTTTSAV
jgi:hypothetical protein